MYFMVERTRIELVTFALRRLAATFKALKWGASGPKEGLNRGESGVNLVGRGTKMGTVIFQTPVR